MIQCHRGCDYPVGHTKLRISLNLTAHNKEHRDVVGFSLDWASRSGSERVLPAGLRATSRARCSGGSPGSNLGDSGEYGWFFLAVVAVGRRHGDGRSAPLPGRCVKANYGSAVGSDKLKDYCGYCPVRGSYSDNLSTQARGTMRVLSLSNYG